MRKKISILLASFIIFILLICFSGCGVIGHRMDEYLMLERMGNGINLGDSLECVAREYKHKLRTVKDYETYWHNPEVTDEWFVSVKDCGFSTVRIPVSWGEHLDSEGDIDPEWMNRVKEVVDMALSHDLYVIIDTHHEDWLIPTYERQQEVAQKLKKLWEQIAQEFRDYDIQLLFEGMNEPRLRGSSLEWTEGTEESRSVINYLNTVFIETVRDSGGKNSERYLLITDYAGSSGREALSGLEYPDYDNIIVSIHCYLPHRFTSDDSGEVKWDRTSPEDTEVIQRFKNDLLELFMKEGIPVLITEYGCSEKKSGNGRSEWTKYFTEEMSKIHIHSIWWDNGGKYRLIDRQTNEITDREVTDLINDSVKTATTNEV